MEPLMPSVGRRLQITHRTGYRYSDVVEASFNEVRMTPLNAENQVLIHHHLAVSPLASLQRYVDYWGAHVDAFDVHVPHRMLEVTAISTVETPPMAPDVPGVGWDQLLCDEVRDRFAEFLAPSVYVDDALLAPARAQIVSELATCLTPREAADGAIAAVRERIEYTAGATNVYTTAEQAWEEGRGVCQDFSHTTISLLRALGIPARYVSGYLHTEEPNIGKMVLAESHAWVEYWNGAWQAVDPTNNRGVGAAHVIVARGRDYSDVPPLKGIYAGGASEGLGVVVEITQLQ
jgi:transglutaminase-like putative cysteine protease